MKILQKEITGTKTSFPTNFGGKQSFILCFLSACTPTCTTTIITLEPCALNAEFHYFIPRNNEISLLCGYHWKKRRWGETEGDFLDNSIVKTISQNNKKQVMIVWNTNGFWERDKLCTSDSAIDNIIVRFLNTGGKIRHLYPHDVWRNWHNWL